MLPTPLSMPIAFPITYLCSSPTHQKVGNNFSNGSKTKSLIEQIDKQIEKVEAEQNQLIDDDEQLSNLNDILQSIPGFEPEVARSLIVELPDLGSGDPAKLCSLAGVVPFNCDSGLFRGKRRIYGGRGTPRTVLYRAALTAVKCVKADNVWGKKILKRGACSSLGS